MILKFPYLSVILNKKTNDLIVCLIQVISKQHISFYDVDKIKQKDRPKFIEMANRWWNMQPSLPISIYYQELFNQFDYCKSYLANNEYTIEQGFEGIKLKNLSDKRIKRKVVHIDDGKK